MFSVECSALEGMVDHIFIDGFRIIGHRFLELSASLCPGLLNGHAIVVLGLYHDFGTLF